MTSEARKVLGLSGPRCAGCNRHLYMGADGLWHADGMIGSSCSASKRGHEVLVLDLSSIESVERWLASE